jgi:hypothetical protein
MYWLLCSDRTGNLPVKSLYIVPVVWSANATKQNTSHFAAWSCGGLLSKFVLSSLLVVRRFLMVLFICPLIVAVDVGRCFLIISSVNPGKPSS